MKSTNKILAAIGLGMAAGAILGLLFAPRKGKETRELMAKKGAKLTDDVKKGIYEGQKKFNSLKEGVKQGMSNLNNKVEEMM